MFWLDKKYASLIKPLVRNFKIKGDDLIAMSCPICGDSATRKHLARGYIYVKDDKTRYMCHNCGISLQFPYFLKRVDPSLYKQYRMEKYKPVKKKKKKEFDYKEIQEKVHVKTGVEILFEPLNNEAKLYLKRRMIEKIDDLYFTRNMSNFQKFFPEKEKLPNDKRIIFPIRNRNKELVGISARAIDPDVKMRYVLLKVKEGEPLIFGLDKVSLDKDVFVTEGAFDSLHLDNAVAVNGSELLKVSEVIPIEKQILVYDNEPRNKEIIRKMMKAASMGYRVVIWPKNLKEKDINLMVRTHGIDKVRGWLENNYKGLKLRAKLADWKLI